MKMQNTLRSPRRKPASVRFVACGVSVTRNETAPSGEPRQQRHGPKPILDDAEARRAALRIQAGESLNRVAPDFKMSPPGLSARLKKLDVVSQHQRPAGHRLTTDELADAARRVSASDSLHQVARETGGSVEAIRRRLREEYGIVSTLKGSGTRKLIGQNLLDAGRRVKQEESLVMVSSDVGVAADTLAKNLRAIGIRSSCTGAAHPGRPPKVDLEQQAYILQLLVMNGFATVDRLREALRAGNVYLRLAPLDYEEVHEYLAKFQRDMPRTNLGRQSMKDGSLSLPPEAFLKKTAPVRPRKTSVTRAKQPNN